MDALTTFGYKWRLVVFLVALHVVWDAGSTFMTWHEAIGKERWVDIHLLSYESIALYIKLLMGICGTILQLKDPTWHQISQKAAAASGTNNASA